MHGALGPDNSTLKLCTLDYDQPINMLHPRALRLWLFLIDVPLFVWFQMSDRLAIRHDIHTFKFSTFSFAGSFLVLFIVLRHINLDLRRVQHTYMFVSS